MVDLGPKVGDRGNINGNILVIGEAPGKQEIKQGLPFIGPSGYKLTAWMKQAGIDPNDVYITNLCDVMPKAKGGAITDAIRKNTLPREYVEKGIERVREIIDSMPNLRVVVPVGNYAAYAVSPGGKVAWDESRAGITSCRGSIYAYTLSVPDRKCGPKGAWGNRVKVIPTIHPAAVMRQVSWERRCLFDWQRIGQEVNEPRIDAPEREHNISPNIDDIADFYKSLGPGTVLSFDIETWGDGLKCVGFSTCEQRSLVIPTTESYWRTQDEVGYALEWIKKILEHPCDKVAQNGLFDCWWLRQYGISVQGYHWDTLAMHHCLDALDNHSLDYLASIFTRQPYWKDEAKAADEIVRVANSVGMERLYVYNGLDVTVTHEIFQRLYDLLRSEGLLKFYLSHYADMHQSILSLMLGGVRVDATLMRDTRSDLLKDAVQKRNEASRLVGKPLWKFSTTKCERDMLQLYWDEGIRDELEMYDALIAKEHKHDSIQRKWEELHDKGISDTSLNEALYGPLGCPSGRKTATGKYKADNVALKTLQNAVRGRKRAPKGMELEAWQKTISDIIDITLDHRRKRKLASFLDPAKIDTDDRLRCTYKFTTKSGRLASSSNPRGTGMNLQNIDRTLRYVFVPSPGRIILECDLSQAEARIVKACTGDPGMIELAKRAPTEGDEHTENAAAIFGIDFDEVSKDQRYLGKRAVHASNYGMKGPRLSEILLKDGYIFTPRECQDMIDAYVGKFPAIRSWQSKVRRVILKEKKLYTSWGRRVKFNGMELDDELYRFGYSYVPQSEIGDLLNQYGLKPLDQFLVTNQMESDLILQVHDSVVLDAEPSEVYNIMQFLSHTLTRPRVYGETFGHEVELSIPVEFSIGNDWSKGKEWKFLPERDEVEEYLKEITA